MDLPKALAIGFDGRFAVMNHDGYGFFVNGKGDGHIRGDAGTQVMSGLIGALVHGVLSRAPLDAGAAALEPRSFRRDDD